MTEDRTACQVSVIVPTHRGSHRLPALLDALRAQSFAGPWEVVIVVDGLFDDTLSLVAAGRRELTIQTVVLDDSRGVAQALNAGYAAAKGRVLIRCDDDLTPQPDMVARHWAWHESAGRRGVIGPTRDAFPDARYARVYGTPSNRRALAAIYERSASDRWIHWAAHNSVTRESWQIIGGFDERFPYGEDSELGWRLMQAGVDLHVDPELEIEHRAPATTAASRVPRAFVAGASRRVFGDVHPGTTFPEPRAHGLRALAWSGATNTLSHLVRTRSGFRRTGAVVDRLLPLLSTRLAGRLIAFTVESAGKSGTRYGPDDLRSLRDQKDNDLSVELHPGPP